MNRFRSIKEDPGLGGCLWGVDGGTTTGMGTQGGEQIGTMEGAGSVWNPKCLRLIGRG